MLQQQEEWETLQKRLDVQQQQRQQQDAQKIEELQQLLQKAEGQGLLQDFAAEMQQQREESLEEQLQEQSLQQQLQLVLQQRSSIDAENVELQQRRWQAEERHAVELQRQQQEFQTTTEADAAAAAATAQDLAKAVNRQLKDRLQRLSELCCLSSLLDSVEPSKLKKCR
ncbi:hypothetical protein cyc_08881 [Cyclospora cayetanensis]|uniref:Uncharacterized protein n=1 Tax=Cyclospora cayetanensis TaxID=88456 RepID=A0A1D3D5P3_9EIME|nr:hypothetical protein cyc_08881 [Cyclospora cayetanensis]